MNKKITYSKEYIIENTYSYIKTNGLQGITTRKLAKFCHCSTAPFYQYFSSIDEVVLEALKIGVEDILNYTNKKYSDRLFLNIGMGVILFARDNSNIYKEIMLNSEFYKKYAEDRLNILRYKAKEDPRFVNMENVDLQEIIDKMWIYVFGLATLVSLKLTEEVTEFFVMNKLLSAGSIIVGDAIEKADAKIGK